MIQFEGGGELRTYLGLSVLTYKFRHTETRLFLSSLYEHTNVRILRRYETANT